MNCLLVKENETLLWQNYDRRNDGRNKTLIDTSFGRLRAKEASCMCNIDFMLHLRVKNLRDTCDFVSRVCRSEGELLLIKIIISIQACVKIHFFLELYVSSKEDNG